MDKQEASPAVTCEFSLTPSPVNEDDLLQPFLKKLQSQESRVPLDLLRPYLSELDSKNEDSVAKALKTLGFILHNEKVATAFSDETCSAVFQSLVHFILSTDRKPLCSLGVWCLGIQEFPVHVLENQLELIVQAIVHAIDNPMGSKAITYEALQAIVKMVNKVSKMRSMASLWAPPIYRRLLSSDKRDRDMVDRCLKDIESALTPVPPSLSKVVATDVAETLLPNMEKMVTSRALVIPTVRAWSWFVRLLGSQAGEKRVLVNQLLKVVEVTFTSPDPQVQVASLVAWEALIDALLDYSSIPSPGNNSVHTETPSACHLSPSVKRLKLLMTPLITIMGSQNKPSVRLACWNTWNYLARKLEYGINSFPVQSVVVVSMFEVIFKNGLDNDTQWVWDLCLNTFGDLISAKFQNNLAPCDSPAFTVGLECSPKTPVARKSSPIARDISTIKWTPWSLESLGSIMKLVKVLWQQGIKNYTNSSCENPSLNGSMQMLNLIIKGIEADGKVAIKPTTEHVNSVHLFIRFIHEVCKESEGGVVSDELVSILWPVIEALKDLGGLVLSSSFYKMSFPDVNNQYKEEALSTPSSFAQKENICLTNNSKDLVTPIVYIIGVWIQVGSVLIPQEAEEVKILQGLESLFVLTKTGLGMMDNLHGVVNLLELFLSSLIIATNTECPNDPKLSKDETGNSKLVKKGIYLLRVWKIFADQLASYIESVNDVPPVESGINDSGYQVIHKYLLYPIQCYLSLSRLPSECPTNNSEKLHSDDELERVTSTWTKLFNCGSRISSLKSSKPNGFASEHCANIFKLIEKQWHSINQKPLNAAVESCFSEALCNIILNVLKHSDISNFAMLALSRKKRFGSYACGSTLVNCQLGNEFEDTSNMRDILSLTSRLLDISWNELMTGKQWWFNFASRVLPAVAGILGRISTQQDILLFLQEFSKPFAKWLSASKRTFEEHNASSFDIMLRQLENLWEKLLSCLQKCQPPLIFESKLLSLQAPLLVPAFHHAATSIANSTLSFWEATYGIKSTSLRYPACLVPVLKQLKGKVNISLPCWEECLDQLSKGKANLNALPRTPSGHKQLRMYQEQMLENTKTPVNTGGSTITPKSRQNREAVYSVGSIKRRSNVKRPASNQTVQADHANVELKLTDVFESTDASKCGSNAQADITRANEEKTTADACNGIGFRMDAQNGVELNNSVPAKLPSFEITHGLQDDSAGPKIDSGASARRKKLRFIDCEHVKYVSIPASPKLQGPLTEHQKEVKQEKSHGIGIKTYTSLDFSQSQVTLESEDPEESVLQKYDQLVDTRAIKSETDVNVTDQTQDNANVDQPTAVLNKFYCPDGIQTGECREVRCRDMIITAGTIETAVIQLQDTVPEERKEKSLKHSRYKTEVKKLGVRKQRFLRSSGCLRGGKRWRNISHLAKAIGGKSTAKNKATAGNAILEYVQSVQSALPTLEEKLDADIEVGMPVHKLSDMHAHEQTDIAADCKQLKPDKAPLGGSKRVRQTSDKKYSQSATPSKKLRSGKNIKLTVSDTSRPANTETNVKNFSENNSIYTKVEADVECNINLKEAEDTQLIADEACLPIDTSDTQLLSTGGDCTESAFAGETQICSVNDTNCLDEIHKCFSNKGLKLDICDHLNALNSTVQWENMDLDTLDSVYKILSDIQGQVLLNRARLMSCNSVKKTSSHCFRRTTKSRDI